MFDEGEVLNQLGKAHMKTILDQDQRDVRLIQELFLEDGDLHSDGGRRQRQFRWRNATDEDPSELGSRTQQEAEDAEADDDQEDSTWRKMRNEREKWLQQQQQQVLLTRSLIMFLWRNLSRSSACILHVAAQSEEVKPNIFIIMVNSEITCEGSVLQTNLD